MGTFLEDLRTNFVEVARSNLNVPGGISGGYSTYVGLTNVFWITVTVHLIEIATYQEELSALSP
jgi:hypothetical protein